MTGGRREESVQFSLKELLKLEDERLEEQRNEVRAREMAELKAREVADANARKEAEAKLRAEADGAAKKRQAELEDVARREAMQKAIVEQSRLEVEVRARGEERELERRHELTLQQLRGAGERSSLGSLAGAAALGGFVMLAVALGIHFGIEKPQASRQIAALEQNVASEQARANELGRRVDASREAIAGLEKNVAALTAENAALKSARTPASPTASHGSRGVPPPPPPPRPVSTVPCQFGDPMCFAIPGR